MSINVDRAYKYDKFNCRLDGSYYHILFDKRRDKVFFMCKECTGCLDEPVAGTELQDNTFTVENAFSDDYWNATPEQIQTAGLDLRHVFKRNRDGGEGDSLE